MILSRATTAMAMAAALLAGALPGSPGVAAAPRASSAGAAPVFGPKTVVMTTCALPASTLNPRAPASVVTALGPAGGIYGFASCRSAVPGAIYFFLSRAGRSTHELTPYRGTLEAMASDGTGAVYLSYSVRHASDTWLYIARRTPQGRYSPPTLLTHTVGTFRPAVTLAAAQGRWWAVWSEATSTEQLPSHALFERRTLLGVRLRHQITFPGTGNSDWQPALGVAGSRIWLVWLRTLSDSLLVRQMVTRGRPDGSWGVGYLLEPLQSEGYDIVYPSRVVIEDGRSYVLLPPAVFLDGGTGHFLRQWEVTAWNRSQLAVSAGVAMVAALNPRATGGRPAMWFHELRGGTWTSVESPTVDSFDGLVSMSGRATLVMHKQNVPMLYLVTEQ